MSRQDQYAVSLAVDGKDLGVWDKFSGGEVDSEELKYRPGGMAPQVSLGGYRNVGNITVSRLFDQSRDLGQSGWLINRVGKGDVTVAKQSLDVDGNPFGKPVVYTGKLKRVTLPEVDSESSDPALVELEISSAGTVTAPNDVAA
jgi:hypothetical protein